MLPEGGRIVPRAYQTWLRSCEKKMDTFELLDRVIYVGPRSDIFGLCGFIVGVYPVLGKRTIEVKFDRAFNGALAIRQGFFNCSSLFSFPKWKIKSVNLRVYYENIK